MQSAEGGKLAVNIRIVGRGAVNSDQGCSWQWGLGQLEMWASRGSEARGSWQSAVGREAMVSGAGGSYQ